MGRMVPGQEYMEDPSASVALESCGAGAGRHWPQPLGQLREAVQHRGKGCVSNSVESQLSCCTEVGRTRQFSWASTPRHYLMVLA